MRKIKYQTRICLLLIGAIIIIMLLSNFFVYQFTINAQFSSLRENLKTIARTSALMIDSDMLLQIPLNSKGVNTPQYKIISA